MSCLRLFRTARRAGSTFAPILIAVALCTPGVVEGDQPEAGVTLRAGIEKESVEGDLRSAIALYERAAREAGSDRALAARALLASADAYRKLGDPRARTAYEVLVARYADQQVYAAAARTRLSKGSASQGQPTLTTRRVLDGKDAERVSPDGRYLLRSGPNLSLYELASGKVRDVTADGIAEEPDHRYPLGAVFSADGQRVAYEFYIEKSERSLLRVVQIGDQIHESRTLVDNPDLQNISPMDWSPDGRWIAVSIRRMDRIAQIGLVDARDGALRVLRSVDWLGPSHMAFSPDSRTVAYDRPSGEGEVERDVFVMTIDGSREFPAVVNPSDDRLVGWAPGGRQSALHERPRLHCGPVDRSDRRREGRSHRRVHRRHRSFPATGADCLWCALLQGARRGRRHLDRAVRSPVAAVDVAARPTAAAVQGPQQYAGVVG